MTETAKPGFFQRMGEKFDRIVDSGKEQWGNFWKKVGEIGTKVKTKVTELRDNFLEKTKPLQERIAASGLHQTYENFKGHVETVKQIFPAVKIAMARAEYQNVPADNAEKIADLKETIKTNAKLKSKCKKEALIHYTLAAEIKKARQEIHESDKTWLTEKWANLGLGGRWERGTKSLREAVANKLSGWAEKLRAINSGIRGASATIATTP